MTRLIDADALKDIEYINKGNFNSVEGIWKWIDNAPTVEPEITNDDLQAAMTESYHLGYELAETKFKRPQGKWVFGGVCVTTDKWYCDQCHLPELEKTDFCPNCGADMRKKEADNDTTN